MTYYLGGYFLIKIRPISFGSLENRSVFTCSSCINDTLLDDWSYSWTTDNNKGISAIKKDFELSIDAIKSIREWTDVKYDNEKSIGWGDVFFDANTAKDYYTTYFSHLDDIKLFALYFDEKEAQEIINEFNPTDSSQGLIGLVDSLKRKISENDRAGETTIGYDLIGIELGGNFHSFHCHDLSSELATKFKLSFNANGLFNNTVNWDAVVEFMNDEDNGFEPVPWFLAKVKLVHSFETPKLSASLGSAIIRD